ncbi:MAG: DUF2332 domain-containing protein [Vicinamibacteria bacterium]
MSDTAGRLAAVLRDQQASCAEMGSPLYAGLLARAAEDVERDGPTLFVLAPHLAPGRGGALALRFLAAVHRLVLTGQADGLARFYPSAGGTVDVDAAWAELRALLKADGGRVGVLVARPCQTNEVGRAAALMFGFLEVAARTRLPFRLLEVGASAGLNLRWDHFRYGGGGMAWGPHDSPVDLRGLWADAPEQADAPIEVVERRGCDPRPLDPTSADDQLALRASVWADQAARFARLSGALELAARVPATVDAGPVEAWVPERLGETRPGTVAVVYHSVVDEYLTDEARRAFHGALAHAGARATTAAPLAWVRVEPADRVRQHAVTVTLWPGGDTRQVALAGAHGSNVRRVT